MSQEVAKAVAETRAKDVKEYDTGRIALYFDPDQSFDTSSAVRNIGTIVRVEHDYFAGIGDMIKVTVELS